MKFKIAALTSLLSLNFCMTSSVDAAVPNNASKYKGHYYKVYNRSLNWHDAKNYCENMGGHLVTITSLNEQIFIYDLLEENGNKNCYWLGGRKNAEGVWHWITHEQPAYVNWAKDQPDNFTGEEDCVMMYRYHNPSSESTLGQWNDICWDGNCNNEAFFGIRNFGFICEWDSKSDHHSGRRQYRDDYYDDDYYYYYYDDDDDDDYSNHSSGRLKKVNKKRDVWE